MRTFALKIITPARTLFAGPAYSCRITTPDGKRAFEAHHEPFLSVLRENAMVQCRGQHGGVQEFSLARGLVSFRDNTCVITGEEG